MKSIELLYFENFKIVDKFMTFLVCCLQIKDINRKYKMIIVREAVNFQKCQKIVKNDEPKMS